MDQTQYSKLISEIPTVDVVVTMGCHVDCPWVPCKYREDWGLEDPTGKPEEDFITARLIESKIIDLKKRLKQGALI